jgi:hypothetical protein
MNVVGVNCIPTLGENAQIRHGAARPFCVVKCLGGFSDAELTSSADDNRLTSTQYREEICGTRRERHRPGLDELLQHLGQDPRLRPVDGTGLPL